MRASDRARGETETLARIQEPAQDRCELLARLDAVEASLTGLRYEHRLLLEALASVAEVLGDEALSAALGILSAPDRPFVPRPHRGGTRGPRAAPPA